MRSNPMEDEDDAQKELRQAQTKSMILVFPMRNRARLRVMLIIHEVLCYNQSTKTEKVSFEAKKRRCGVEVRRTCFLVANTSTNCVYFRFQAGEQL